MSHSNSESLSVVIDRMTETTNKLIKNGVSNETENSKPILDAIAKKSTIRIAGPCALQNAEQAGSIAELIKGEADFMRAPHHKPRTRPFNPQGERLYTGIGAEEALPIYKEISESGLPIATEIMEPNHLAVLQDVMRLAWVGSRTTVGTLIEKIGEESLKVGMPIMVKNPLVDHFPTHIGMIEAAIAGSQGKVPVMACIRGICPSTPEEIANYRNVPNFDHIEKLREAFPDLPIIIDPSHMVHSKDPNPVETVRKILIEAMSRGASGHMVEVNHPDHPSVTDPGIPVHAYLEMINSHSSL